MGEMRTYWLSFTDSDLPKGQQFLGALVIDVSQDELGDLAVMFTALEYGGGEAFWVAAALRQAHLAGVNPGGEVAPTRIDDLPSFALLGPLYPRLRLLSRDEVTALDAQVEAIEAQQKKDSGPVDSA